MFSNEFLDILIWFPHSLPFTNFWTFISWFFGCSFDFQTFFLCRADRCFLNKPVYNGDISLLGGFGLLLKTSVVFNFTKFEIKNLSFGAGRPTAAKRDLTFEIVRRKNKHYFQFHGILNINNFERDTFQLFAYCRYRCFYTNFP